MDTHQVKATFFILGEVADRHPDLIISIHKKGHEIGCHGMDHSPLWKLNPEQFDLQLKRFRKRITEILGPSVSITSYRAPTFSLDEGTRFALRVLSENGFLIDSSVFPVKNYLYGVKDAPLSVYRPDFDNLKQPSSNGPLLEFPLTVLSLGPIKIPWSGGIYLRFMPLWAFKMGLRYINRERPFVLYLHPWELNPSTPRLPKIGWLPSLFTYYGISRTRRKFESLLKAFSFAPLADILSAEFAKR